MKAPTYYARTVIWMFLVILAAFRAQSQKQADLKLEDLQAPYSPAFILMDVAPTSIERPATAKAFGTSIVNSVAENHGIPENYAVEFTPFWFFKHPGFTAYKYFGINPVNNGRKPFSSAKMASVSLAYVNKKAVDSLSPSTSNISFGMRSTLIKVASKKDVADIASLNDQIAKMLNPTVDILASIKIQIRSAGNAIAKLTEKLKTEQDSGLRTQFRSSIQILETKIMVLNQRYSHTLDSLSTNSQLTEAENQLRAVLGRKPVFSLDGAAAVNWGFNNFDYKSSYLDRAGGWLTMDLSMPLSKKNSSEHKYYFSLYISGRYLSGKMLNTANDTTRQDCLDTGGKLELELDRFTLSYEYMYRNNFTLPDDHSFRSSGLVKYKVSDAICLSAAFGKNFGDFNNLIAQLGLNWAFGSGNESVKAGPAQ